MTPATASAIYRRITQLALRIARIRHPLSGPDVLYRFAWDMLASRPWMSRLARRCENPYQFLPEEILATSLARRLNTRKNPYFPHIAPASAVDAQTLSSIRGGAIVVSVHTGRPHTTELLLRAGLPVSLLSANPRHGLQRLYPALRVMPTGTTSLARVRQELLNGRVVSCAVDQRRDRQGDYCLVNTGVFELARRLQAPMHFTSSGVGPSGEILKHISPPHFILDTRQGVMAFIKYYNDHRRQPKRLESLVTLHASPLTPPTATPSATPAPPAQSR